MSASAILKPAHADAGSIMAALADASIEISAKHHRHLAEGLEALKPRTAVFISLVPGETYQDALLVAGQLRRAGFEPVPHVIARSLASFTQLNDYVARAKGDAGVERMLVIAGDGARPVGPYESSLQLIKTGVFEKHGIGRLSVAGHPEGSPRMSAQALEDALTEKLAFAARTGIQLTFATQFVFEAEPVIAWVERLRLRNVEAPVRVGLAGPASISTLMKFALRCGVGPSIRALGLHAAAIARLLTVSGPEPVIRRLAPHVAPHVAPGAAPAIEGFHFFPFGGFVKTARWLTAAQDGRFEIGEGEPGFRVAV
jgi:methylenetetrahydrofolate reductase (NADPH)